MPIPPHSTTDKKVRGLTTVAYLKANFDAGRDYMQFFEPLIRDYLSNLSRPDFAIEDIQASIEDTYGLVIPAPALRTLCARETKRGLIKRDGGRYWKGDKLKQVAPASNPHFSLQDRYDSIGQFSVRAAEALRAYGLDCNSPEDALECIAVFLEVHKIHALLNPHDPIQMNDNAPLDEGSLPRKKEIAVAYFIANDVAKDRFLSEQFQNILEGLVIKNVVMLEELSQASSSFKGLHVYVDTSILLPALGLEGETAQQVVAKTCKLLREAEARIWCFDKTLHEVRRILMV